MKPSAKDFYERMGLKKAATFEQIKKAYRKAVLRYHPDRNPDNVKESEENLKKINEAYEILKDSKKRDIYDQYGEEGLKGGGGGGFGFEDLFGGGLFGQRRGGPRNEGPKKAPVVKQPLNVTLEDVYNGKVRKIKVTRKRYCQGCKGTGSTKKGAVATCKTCKGKGQVTIIRQMGPGFMSQQTSICRDCRGEGKNIDKKYLCKQCKGDRVAPSEKVLEVHIDKGMKHGHKIEFEGEADEIPGYDKAGDIFFILQERPHKKFVREGSNLTMNKKINLSEALTGVEFVIEQLDGRQLLVSSSPGDIIHPGMVKQIANEGMPHLKRPFEKGNLYIKFEVEFPKAIPKDIQSKLISMLPEKKKVEMPTESKKKKPVVEKVFLEVPQFQRTQGGHKEAYEEDDDDERRGGSINCNIQ